MKYTKHLFCILLFATTKLFAQEKELKLTIHPQLDATTKQVVIDYSFKNDNKDSMMIVDFELNCDRNMYPNHTIVWISSTDKMYNIVYGQAHGNETVNNTIAGHSVKSSSFCIDFTKLQPVDHPELKPMQPQEYVDNAAVFVPLNTNYGMYSIQLEFHYKGSKKKHTIYSNPIKIAYKKQE